ncbi:MAG: OmpA family protein [Gammaproteobacteria bacterium]
MAAFLSKFAAAAFIALLSCHSASARAQAGDFTDALARAYEQLAELERRQGDSRDADVYMARAQAARRGEAPPPEAVAARVPFLDEVHVSALSGARERLVSALAAGAREKAAQPAARAQSSYDCWLEQASEDLQPDHIAACRQAFDTAMAAVDDALAAPPPEPEKPVAAADSDGDGVPDAADDCPQTAAGTPVDASGCPRMPKLEGVHFAFDKATLTASAEAVLDGVVRTVEDNPHVRLELVGHTDSVGDATYNRKLSQQRADAARDYLVAQGIDADRLSTAGRGESTPIADNSTAEGRAENRRVEITARPAR